MSTTAKAALAVAVLAAIVGAAVVKRVFVGGAQPSRSGVSETGAPPARFLTAVGASASSEPLRRGFLGLVDLIVDQVAPRHPLIRVYPLARTHTVAYSGAAKSARDPWRPLDPYLADSALGYVHTTSFLGSRSFLTPDAGFAATWSSAASQR